MTVSEVSEESLADTQGIAVGDEVILVNDVSVTELGWEGVETLVNSGLCTIKHVLSVMDSLTGSLSILTLLIILSPPANCFSATSVSLTLRTVAQSSISYSSSHNILEGLICPAPPSRQRELSGEALQNLIVPKPVGRLFCLVLSDS